MPASRDTLLRLLRGLPDPPIGGLSVLGVDDFALRRGHVYGTVVIDMVTGRPVDLLPDRETETLAAWLLDHPGVEVICRDRAGAYTEAARLGSPDAVQVADRWHLWRNLGQAVEKTVDAHRAHLTAATPAGTATGAELGTPPPLVQAVPEKKIVIRMREQHAAVHELWARGLSKAAIGRQLGLHPATVRKLANAGSLEDLTPKTEQRAHLVGTPLSTYTNGGTKANATPPGCSERSPNSATRAGNWPCSVTRGASATGEDMPRCPARNPRPSARSPAGS